MANRGEKHFKNGGRNQSTRKYQNVIVIDHKFKDEKGNSVVDEYIVSCRPARAKRALMLYRTKFGFANVKLDKRKRVA